MISDNLKLMVVLAVYFLTINKYRTYFNRNAVVVRIKHPTECQIRRYFKWKKLLSTAYDFWFIINEEKSSDKNNLKNIFYIKTEDVLKKYPKLKELSLLNRCIKSQQKNNKFYMWISHTESVTIWYNYTEFKYDYVWILEQDLGVTGNIYKILKYYDTLKKDLITYDIDKSNKNEFNFINCYSNEYFKWRSKYISINKSYTTREFIQRWSKKLFLILNEELINGLHAISEMSIIETVLFNNLSYKLLEKNHIGYKFKWRNRVVEKEWRIIESNITLKNKLFHPLKF